MPQEIPPALYAAALGVVSLLGPFLGLVWGIGGRTSRQLKERTAALEEARQSILAREDALRLNTQRLTVALEVGRTAVFTLDRDLRYSWVHGSQVGYEDYGWVGKTEFDFFTRESAEMLTAIYREVIDTGIEVRRDVTVRSLAMPADQHFHLAVQPWHDADGAITGVVCAAYDITQRKLAEQKLQESEIRHRSTFEQAAVGIGHAALDGRFTQVNLKLCAMLGYSREELLAQTFQSLTYPEDREATTALSRQLTAGEIPSYSIEKRYIRSDGTPLWVNVNVVLVQSPAGEPDYFMGVVKKIHRRKMAEEQLGKLWLAVEQSPVSIIITDPRGAIEYVNPRFTQTTGYSAEEALGGTPRIVKSGEMPPEYYQALWRTITAGGEWSGEMRNRKKSGELFWELVRIIPVLSKAGEVVGFMAVKEDITERKEQEQRERARQEQMLHNGRLITMGEMAAAMAHELNQPLTAIANFSGVIERRLAGPANPEEIRQIAAGISGQALRAGEIIHRMRGFVRKQDDRRMAPIDLNTVICDTVRLAEITLRDRSVPIVVDLTLPLPPVAAERTLIEQVLFNLIKNGVESMEDSPRERRLEIGTGSADGDGGVLVEVRDLGCGLPDPGTMDIFATFSTTKPQGMGMGLSICRSIIEAHGGRLGASNNPEAGATFFFTLPTMKESLLD